MTELSGTLLAWWTTAWLHGAILLALVWTLERLRLLRAPAWRETAWRAALFVPLLSAGLQTFGLPAPLAGRWDWGKTPSMAERSGASIERYVMTAPVQSVSEGQTACCAATVAAGQASRADAATPPTPRTVAQDPASAPSAAQAPPFAAFPWSLLAVVLAALWASLRLLGVARSWWRERRRIAALPAVEEAALQASARELCQRNGQPLPRLLRDPLLASPAAWSPATICLPDWIGRGLNPRQHRAMLAHELAHLQRRDPQWRLALALHAALLPLPLGALARARLDALAEHACDAAATRCAEGRALAEALAACAEHLHACRAPSRLAAPMAQARSGLLERVQRLIEEKPMSFETPSSLRRAGALALLVAASLALPGFAVGETSGEGAERAAPPAPPAPPSPPAPPAAPAAIPAPPAVPAPPAPPQPPAPPARGSVSYTKTQWVFGESIELEIDDGERELELEADGDFKFNAAENDIASFDDELSIEESVDGVTRRIEFKRGDDGIERRYQVDGETRALDEDARRWLGEVIPRVLREAAIDVDRRVARIHREGGVPAVLEEIGRISGGHGRARYLGALFGLDGLSAADLQRAMELARSIDSDYEKRVALRQALRKQTLPVAAQVALLGMVAEFESDYERRVLLQTAAEHIGEQPEVVAAWVAAVKRGESAYETRVALQALFERDRLPAEALQQALQAVAAIDGDYERRVALQAAVPHLQQQPALAVDFAQALQRMESDYEQRVAIQSLVDELPLEGEAGKAVIDAAARIGSSYERRVALVSIAESMAADADLIERCRAAAQGMDDYERGQVERALDRLRS